MSDTNIDYIESEDDTEEPTAAAKTATEAKPTVVAHRGSKKRVSSLFLNRDGTSISFYILKKSMDKPLVDELEHRIVACGGTIVDKLPQDGYVLVDQCTKPGTHFIRAYSNPALDRRIVSMRFVEESMARRELVPYPALILFIKAGVPVLFHLHESLEEAEQEVLSSSISLRGGNPKAEPEDAQVLIHGYLGRKQLNSLQLSYNNIACFETPAWLDSCIKGNRFRLTSRAEPAVKPDDRPTSMPRRKPGVTRNMFTPDDDVNLTAWMAEHFGYERKGRLGERAYRALVEVKKHKSWSYRHTWSSWRERYKKNQAMFDKKVVEYLQKRPPALRKTVSSQDTKPTSKGKRKVKEEEESMATEEDTDSTEPGEESKYLPSTSQAKKRAHTDSVVYNTRLQSQKSLSSQPALPAPPSTPPPQTVKAEEAPAPPLKSSQSRLAEISDFPEVKRNSAWELDLDPALLDPELLGPDARAIVQAYRTKMETSDDTEDKAGDQSEDEDEDVDVGGVSQYMLSPRKIALSLASSGVTISPQKQASTSASTTRKAHPTATPTQSLARQISQISSDFGIRLDIVEGYFKQEIEDGAEEEEALESTCEYIEQFAKDRRKKKERKG